MPFTILGFPSLSVVGMLGAVFKPLSIQGEVELRWKSTPAMNWGLADISCGPAEQPA